MDEAYLIAPLEIEKGAFNYYRTTQVDFKFFSSVVNSACKKIKGLERYCNKVKQKLTPPITIVLPSNGIEAGLYPCPENEISAYVSRILPFTTSGESILVKGHPRERISRPQSKKLTSELNIFQRKAIHVINFKEVPIELFLPFLSFQKAITLHSTSGVTLAYMCPKNLKLLIGIGKTNIQRYLTETYKYHFFINEQYRSLSVQRALNNKPALISIPKILKEVKKKKRELDDEPKYFIKGKALVSPLTNKPNIILLKTIKTKELIRKWKILFNIDITKKFHEIDEIYLFECNQTKLRFFYPFNIIGSKGFFQKSNNNIWHSQPSKTESQIVSRYINKKDRVLKVNLGDKRRSHYYNVVCSFHQLQIVTDPKLFLESQIRSLKRKGKLIISLPNHDYYLIPNQQLLRMPPHQVSLWNKESVEKLENLFKIKLVNFHFIAQENFIPDKVYQTTVSAIFGKKIKAKLLKILYNFIDTYLPALPSQIADLYSQRYKADTILAVFEKL